jgi:hypothetical protein
MSRFWEFIKRMVTSWKVWLFTVTVLVLAGFFRWFVKSDQDIRWSRSNN